MEDSKRHGARVTIARDDWGIAHVKGETDADAVFGMIYAQAEDDFNRIETNYLISLGRLAEADGRGRVVAGPAATAVRRPGKIAGGLWAKSNVVAGADASVGGWTQHLSGLASGRTPASAHAFRTLDGIELLRGQHRGVTSNAWRCRSCVLFTRIRWRSLLAGIGVTSVVARLQDTVAPDLEPRGSNGFAIAPSHTEHGHALLLINPHTSFYFRSELQMTSREGLDAYGAVTWGQFFIYQGFNAKAGWMHTSSGIDNVDEFAETIVKNADGTASYRYGTELRPVLQHRA